MNTTLTLIPLLGLLALVLLSILFSNVRAARLDHLKAEHEKFLRHVRQEDSTLQESLLTDLLQGKPPGETLDAFIQHRAALLPARTGIEPATWDASELDHYAQSRFAEQVAEVNRKLGFQAGFTGIVLVGSCLVSAIVIYQFAASTPLEFPASIPNNPLPPAFNESSPPPEPKPAAPAPPGDSSAPNEVQETEPIQIDRMANDEVAPRSAGCVLPFAV